MLGQKQEDIGMFDLEDIETLRTWGLIVHPIKLKISNEGKKSALFLRPDMVLVNEWAWIKKDKQMSVETILNLVNKGFQLAAILPKNMFVLDVDDNAAYQSALSFISKNKLNSVVERSSRWNPKNNKHHFFFRSKKSMPYKKEFKKIGLKGKGELLGEGHLVYLNINGWIKAPKLFPKLSLVS